MVSRMRKLVRPALRERVAAAFAKIAGAVDARTAQRRTKAAIAKAVPLGHVP